MNSSNSSHRSKASRAHPTSSFLVILDDGTRRRFSDRELARQMRQPPLNPHKVNANVKSESAPYPNALMTGHADDPNVRTYVASRR